MTPEEVVDAFYAALFAGDHEAALSHCTPDAVYHSQITPGQTLPPAWRWGEGPIPVRVYLTEIMAEFMATAQDYAITSMERDTVDTLLVSRLRTTLGSGVMIFRVDGDKLAHIWVIRSRAQGDPTF